MGDDVDTMRQHLLDELDASRRASEALVLGQPAVQALQAALSQLSPPGPGLEVAAQIESAEGVLAGDFLDIVDLGTGRTAVVLGDVSGHGHEAAVVGLRLKSALVGDAPPCRRPARRWPPSGTAWPANRSCSRPCSSPWSTMPAAGSAT